GFGEVRLAGQNMEVDLDRRFQFAPLVVPHRRGIGLLRSAGKIHDVDWIRAIARGIYERVAWAQRPFAGTLLPRCWDITVSSRLGEIGRVGSHSWRTQARTACPLPRAFG